MKSNDRQDAIRLISGGPGSGKSSFAKIFAREQCEGDWRVLFVPLHRFPISDDLVTALSRFAKNEALFPVDPFDAQKGERQLLLIFDGLDELASQGAAGHQAARDFIEQVQQAVNGWTASGRTIKVLVTGRTIVVSELETRFRRPRQIVNVIPYLENKKDDYEDPKELLSVDQRDVWWRRYGQAIGKTYDALPNQLCHQDLDEVTAQPLLNYLMAIALEQGVEITSETNMNSVYEHLIGGVFNRPWADKQHPALQPFAEEREFFLILQEIAVAIWHGNGRAATRSEIMSRCQSGVLERLFGNLEMAAADGVTRLLTAFYFRRSGDVGASEGAFEFSHKSFGEYLTGRRIVHQMEITAEERQRNEGGYSGWSEQDSLKHWIALCGPKPMDRDLFRFISREVALAWRSKDAKVKFIDWQSTFDGLLCWELRHGMPMQVVQGPMTFREQVLWAQNSEEALLACGYAVAEATQKLRLIEWPEPTSLGLMVNMATRSTIDTRQCIDAGLLGTARCCVTARACCGPICSQFCRF